MAGAHDEKGQWLKRVAYGGIYVPTPAKDAVTRYCACCRRGLFLNGHVHRDGTRG